jgi:hypothetical protein
LGISDFEMVGLGNLKNGFSDTVQVGCLEGTPHFPQRGKNVIASRSRERSVAVSVAIRECHCERSAAVS